LAITLIVFFSTNQAYAFFLLIILPFSAWSYLQMKKQLR
jgi:hypothetical protein